VPRVVELVTTWDPCALVIDSADAAASIKVDLDEFAIEPELTTAREFALACGGLFDDIDGDQFCHLGQQVLDDSATTADKKALGGAWAWDRNSPVYTAPVIALTVARHGFLVHGRPAPPPADPQLASADGATTSETADLARAGF